ncbi:MAG: hypothetical protein M3328_15650, partial [Chloroflexota bacterium]|nr:hypothetical protein [Chloroflexota bacterium]
MTADTSTANATNATNATNTTSNDKARLFVAIELPQNILDVIEGIQVQTRENLGQAANLMRWSRPEGIHITLQFLGETPTARIPEITQAME